LTLWRLLYVRPRGEMQYQAQMAERRLESYVPMETVWIGEKEKRKPSPRPLLPGYVFINVTDYELADAIRLPGVLYMIRTGDRPAEVSGFVASLMEDERRGAFDRTRRERREIKRKGKPLSPGERFTVINGSFKGMTGVVIGRAGKHSAYVDLEMFGRVCRLEADYTDLKVILADDVAQKAA